MRHLLLLGTVLVLWPPSGTMNVMVEAFASSSSSPQAVSPHLQGVRIASWKHPSTFQLDGTPKALASIGISPNSRPRIRAHPGPLQSRRSSCLFQSKDYTASPAVQNRFPLMGFPSVLTRPYERGIFGFFASGAALVLMLVVSAMFAAVALLMKDVFSF